MFLVVGESLIDLVPQSGQAPHTAYAPMPGGAPYNFARALGLQGVPAGYLNPFSDDAFGKLLRDTLAGSGASHLGATSTKPTSLAVVATDAHGQPNYSFYREGVADRELTVSELVATTRGDLLGFHTGGLALLPPDDALAIKALAHYRMQGVLCSVDINMRPAVARSMAVPLPAYRDAVLSALALAHIVKVSDEDLRHLGFEDDARSAARALLAHGPQLVLLTLGAQGACAIAASLDIAQAALPAEVVDAVGAGDCFFGGFIASLVRDDALPALTRNELDEHWVRRALRHASACASINLSRKGCAPPTWAEAAALAHTAE